MPIEPRAQKRLTLREGKSHAVTIIPVLPRERPVMCVAKLTNRIDDLFKSANDEVGYGTAGIGIAERRRGRRGGTTAGVAESINSKTGDAICPVHASERSNSWMLIMDVDRKFHEPDDLLPTGNALKYAV